MNIVVDPFLIVVAVFRIEPELEVIVNQLFKSYFYRISEQNQTKMVMEEGVANGNGHEAPRANDHNKKIPLEAALNHVPLFRHLPQELRDATAGLMVGLQFSKGDEVCRQGDGGHVMFFHCEFMIVKFN